MKWRTSSHINFIGIATAGKEEVLLHCFSKTELICTCFHICIAWSIIFKFKIQSHSVCLHSWLAKGTEAYNHCAHPTRLCRCMLHLNGKCNLPFPEYHLQWLWMAGPGAPMHCRPSFSVSLVELLLGRFSQECYLTVFGCLLYRH